MLKRVNIQYSIDLEELPSEVDRIYLKAKNIFNKIELPEVTGEEILTADILKKIDCLRRDLTCLDHALSDISGIVGSYVEYELSTMTPAQNYPQETEQSAQDTAKMP